MGLVLLYTLSAVDRKFSEKIVDGLAPVLFNPDTASETHDKRTVPTLTQHHMTLALLQIVRKLVNIICEPRDPNTEKPHETRLRLIAFQIRELLIHENINEN